MGLVSRVEVCLRTESVGNKAWYNASFVDITDRKNVRVVIDVPGNADARTIEVSATQVRFPPACQALDQADALHVDDIVEVLRPATPKSVECWYAAIVRTISGQFVYVSLLGETRNEDLIVHRRSIRRPSTAERLSDVEVKREVVQLNPRSLGGESETPDWLHSVHSQAQLLSASVESSNQGLGHSAVFVGKADSVKLASHLVTIVHMKHQAELSRSHYRNRRLEQILAGDPTKSCILEFGVDEELVGRLIGKSGHNLLRMQEQFGVKIEVQNDVRMPDDPSQLCVRIYGPNDETVQAARRNLDIIKVELPVPKEQIGWILGKGYQNLQDISRKAGLVNARFLSSTQVIELQGLRDCVESAKLLIDTHADYWPVYQEMDQECGLLEQSFKALDLEQKQRKGQRIGKATAEGGSGNVQLPQASTGQAQVVSKAAVGQVNPTDEGVTRQWIAPTSVSKKLHPPGEHHDCVPESSSPTAKHTPETRKTRIGFFACRSTKSTHHSSTTRSSVPPTEAHMEQPAQSSDLQSEASEALTVQQPKPTGNDEQLVSEDQQLCSDFKYRLFPEDDCSEDANKQNARMLNSSPCSEIHRQASAQDSDGKANDDVLPAFIFL